jgi:hypothetical protein
MFTQNAVNIKFEKEFGNEMLILGTVGGMKLTHFCNNNFR